MSHFATWFVLCMASTFYHVVGIGNVDTLSASIWFGGLGLFVHWLFNRSKS